MQPKIDAAYLSLREKILFTEVPAGKRLLSKDIAEELDISDKMAKKVLYALNADGYLRKSGHRYLVASFNPEQIHEWRMFLCSMVEIGCMRITIGGPDSVQKVRDFVDENLRSVETEDESFFLSVMGYVNLLLGGPGSSLADIVGQFVPQAYFRLHWLSDIYAERKGFIVESADQMCEAAGAGDMTAVRNGIRYFFQKSSPAIYRLIEEMGHGPYPKTEKETKFQEIEMRTSGQVIDVSSTYRPRLILAPLASSPKRSHQF